MANRSVERRFGATNPGPPGPWIRWWWPGNVLDDDDIREQLLAYARAGFRGVEVSPIYGVPGTEHRQVDLLSEEFGRRLATTIREADRVGMRVDLILGSGWPYGGPWVTESDAARTWVFDARTASGGVAIRTAVHHPNTGSAPPAMALAVRGSERVALGPHLNPATGVLDWTPPDGDEWTLHFAWGAPTGQKVKRAGPGGAGNVLDHYDAGAVERHLRRFETLLRSLPRPGIRCIFNDSWEVYGADTTPSAPDLFRRRFGYELGSRLDAFARGGPDARTVRTDYRNFIESAIRNAFLETTKSWAHRHGCLFRNQAHGSPGNLLDLYAAVDIPEAEVFGGAVLRRAGMLPLGGTPAADRDTAFEELLVCRMAGSAASVAGCASASAEAFTWLGDHGRTPLAHMVAEAAQLFAAGIVELVFHGGMANPRGLPWPGWRFYASTHVGPTTSWWNDLPELTAWMTRCQTLLRRGDADGDFLLLQPDGDELPIEAEAALLRPRSVHGTATWLRHGLTAFTRVAKQLDADGWCHDLVSETLLRDRIRAVDGVVRGAKGCWRAVLVPESPPLRTETLEHLHRLAIDGASVVLLGRMPSDNPTGTCPYGDAARREALLQQWMEILRPCGEGNFQARLGAGRLLVARDFGAVPTLLDGPTPSGPAPPMRRRRDRDGLHVFVYNPGPERVESVVVRSSLPQAWRSAKVEDPWTGTHWRAEAVPAARRAWHVRLPLEPGESRLLRLGGRTARLPAPPDVRLGSGFEVRGPWTVEAVRGGPSHPRRHPEVPPGDWCALGSDWRDFAGTARYQTRVELPAEGQRWTLDLGDVRHSVRVCVNGAVVGTRIAPPWRIPLPPIPGRHVELELEVTNLDANGLAALDRRGVDWKPFFLVGADYKPFDASRWDPLPSGLIGPVRMLPHR
ncbi:MAG: glycosyl hydrolase [Armatimonadota bacterium]